MLGRLPTSAWFILLARLYYQAQVMTDLPKGDVSPLGPFFTTRVGLGPHTFIFSKTFLAI